MQNVCLPAGLPAGLPACLPAGLPACQVPVAGGWWPACCLLRSRGGREGLGLDVSVTAPFTNNFLFFDKHACSHLANQK